MKGQMESFVNYKGFKILRLLLRQLRWTFLFFLFLLCTNCLGKFLCSCKTLSSERSEERQGDRGNDDRSLVRACPIEWALIIAKTEVNSTAPANIGFVVAFLTYLFIRICILFLGRLVFLRYESNIRECVWLPSNINDFRTCFFIKLVFLRNV